MKTIEELQTAKKKLADDISKSITALLLDFIKENNNIIPNIYVQPLTVTYQSGETVLTHVDVIVSMYI